ncbi:hypothetical protein CJU90_1889 [Yarrowia sp. C11]|nr:hypothetical protein CKK34_5917 [Yarrowia sp. E02]KAG5371824.1 hypothetical protein CJU90_1889 [Yarrowia sp. C11]
MRLEYDLLLGGPMWSLHRSKNTSSPPDSPLLVPGAISTISRPVSKSSGASGTPPAMQGDVRIKCSTCGMEKLGREFQSHVALCDPARVVKTEPKRTSSAP